MGDPRGLSGKSLSEITLEALAAGTLEPDDVRIAPATLRDQADLAERQGYGPLAQNLRRAAELALLGDEAVLALYEVLRPGRASAAELSALADRLRARSPLTAALVRSACEAYEARGLLRESP